MRVVVLSAGTGSRLGELTKNKPKALVQVGGVPLVDHLLAFIDHSFFEEILVVGGFAFDGLKAYLESKRISKIKVIWNPLYRKGNIFTLLRAMESFSGDSFLVTNIDHIYPRGMFDKMKRSLDGLVAMCDFDRALTADDMKVKLNHDHKTIKMISKQLTDFDGGYIGMTFVDRNAFGLYQEAVNKALAKFGDACVVENVLQLLAETGNPPKSCDLSGFGWYEVDNQEDLKKAEKRVLLNRSMFPYIR